MQKQMEEQVERGKSMRKVWDLCDDNEQIKRYNKITEKERSRTESEETKENFNAQLYSLYSRIEITISARHSSVITGEYK